MPTLYLVNSNKTRINSVSHTKNKRQKEKENMQQYHHHQNVYMTSTVVTTIF